MVGGDHSLKIARGGGGDIWGKNLGAKLGVKKRGKPQTVMKPSYGRVPETWELGSTTPIPPYPTPLPCISATLTLSS